MSTWRRRLPWLIALGLLLLPTTEARAVPITYQMTLVVTETLSSGLPHPIGGLHPILVGNRYFGIFSVDSEFLTRTGEGLHATMYSFRLQVENVVWDMLNPSPHSAFAFFQGPDPEGGPILSYGTPSPGFNVHDGVITGIYGAVFGSSVTFVGFDRFEGSGGFVSRLASSFTQFSDVALRGDYSVARVPAPATLLLLGVGLAAAVGASRSWHRRK